MPIPTRKPAGQMLDPTWASATSHPCHSLAGHVKGLFLVPTSGSPYDASGLNTLTVDAAVTNDGFAGHIDNAAPLNALKNVLVDFTVLAFGVILSQDTNAGALAGYRGNEAAPACYTGLVPRIYYSDKLMFAVGRVQSATDVQFNQAQLSGGAAAGGYIGSWLSGGTFSAKSEGQTLQSSTWTPAAPGTAPTLAQLEAESTWLIGTPLSSTTRETRAEYVVVFDAPATEAQMDYLAAHPDEMLMAMSSSTGTGTGGVTGTGVGASVAAASTREIFSLLPPGQLLRDTSGSVVTDATFTLVQFTDCDMVPVDSVNLPVGMNLSGETSEILQVNSMGYGVYCVEYLIQPNIEAHLIAMPVKAGHAFDVMPILMKYTVSSNDLQNVSAACVNALNSANAVLAAVTQIQATTQKLDSMIEKSGAAYRLASDSLANVISQLLPSTPEAILELVQKLQL